VTPQTVLVLGGARAGKSTFAVARARAVAGDGGRVAFVATAEAGDGEMTARIARHRTERPAHWDTVESPRALVDALVRLRSVADVVVVDCLTLWVANLLDRSDDELAAEIGRLAEEVDRPAFELILVSNEVGLGVHPETALGRRYRDALGRLNQAVAQAAMEVVLLVAGCPLWLKGPP
jgi:adenosylcobinamide kinase/adenosylcobinamide-phosphate guanylyltransferase